MRRLAFALTLVSISAPVPAQTAIAAMPGMTMPGMAMPAPSPPKPAASAAPLAAPKSKVATDDTHAGHNAPTAAPAAPMDHAGHDMKDMAQPVAPAAPDPHAGHDMSGMSGAAMPGMAMTPATTEEIGTAPAPAPPTDHAADAIWGAAAQAPSRSTLRREHGAFQGSMILFNLAEYQARKGGDSYRWEGEGWFGGDINRFVLKTEGEGELRGPLEKAEVQALYARAIDPWWNLQAGIRYDIRPNPQRAYATLGIEGLAPYWFKTSAALFLSNKGELLARVEGFYDQRITQRLIAQPRGEINLAAQNGREIGVGAGLSDIELGLRLRYEIRREFAPYIGVEWASKVGNTARFARDAGEKVNSVNYVAGIRFWF